MLVLLLLSQLLFAEPIPLYNTGLEASDLLHPKTQEPLSSEQVLKLNTDSSKLEPEKTTYYDGVKKNKTIIGQDCFIGSNTSLVAPLKIKKGSIIGAGTVVNQDIPIETVVYRKSELIKKHKKK